MLFPRVVVIVFQKRMVVLDAGSLDNKYVIRIKSFKNESTAGADALVEVPKLRT